MGFNKKDLGDVVWSSETGRDPVFLTSRPKTRSTQQTLPRIHPGRTHIAFDDHHLVPDAGLFLPVILARHLGLPQLVDRHLDLGHAPGQAVTGDKMMTLGPRPCRRRLHRRRRRVAKLVLRPPQRMTPGSSAEPSGNGTRKAALTDGHAGRPVGRSGRFHNLRYVPLISAVEPPRRPTAISYHHSPTELGSGHLRA